jgi:argonaute-like protein implicated in RNA metabolism and viral defense
MVAAVAALAIGLITYFLKRTMSTVDAHDKDINEGKRLFATKEELKELKGELRDETKSLTDDVAEIKDNYLTKDDYYRAQAALERKLDQIYGLLIKYKGGAELE